MAAKRKKGGSSTAKRAAADHTAGKKPEEYATVEHRLPGPPATSLLGFLSLVGLLRALEESRSGASESDADDWSGRSGNRRAFWDLTMRDVLDDNGAWRPRLSWGGDLVPSLHIDYDAGEEGIAAAAVSGIESIGRRQRFPKPNVGVELDEFAAWQREMDPDAVTAIGSDACAKRNDRGKADATPLCMMFGAGHQKFLERLETATAVDESNRRDAIGEVREALFRPWSYSDTLPKIGFRWDPTEYHPHALHAAPNTSEIRTVNGANRLAAVGLAAFECCPGRGGRLETVSCVQRRRRLADVLWPVWSEPLSLAAVRTAMRLPEIRVIGRAAAGDAFADGGGGGTAAAMPAALSRLKARGITGVMRATLFWDGKYKSVRTAELLA